MTGKKFRRQIILTISIVFALAAFDFFVLWGGKSEYLEVTKTAPALVVAIGAAWLAFCWQRRVAFTKALFDTWQKIVGSVQDAVQYTHLTSPTQSDFSKVCQALSCRIDDVRGVFKNVGEVPLKPTRANQEFVKKISNASSVEDYKQALESYRKEKDRDFSVYPFESLKQILHVVQQLGYGKSFEENDPATARKAIMALWQILRGQLLKELDRDFPEFPDTPYRRS